MKRIRGYDDKAAKQYFDLTGRSALITGATRGIGFGLAAGLAQAGAKIILNGRNPKSWQKRLTGCACRMCLHRPLF